MHKNILVIGIAGGSGSGKSTLVKNLIAEFPDMVTVLSHDNYYRRHDELTYEQRTHLNYDEPGSLETDLMARHLEILRQGGLHRMPGVRFHHPQPAGCHHSRGAGEGYHRGGHSDF